MKTLVNSEGQNLILNIDLEFTPDLGKEECLEQFEEETLRQIINPVENYETNKFIHEPYLGMTNQCDIWFYFYFYNGLVTPTHVGGLDYSLTGISPQENAKMLKQSTKSFFRLEFYKVPDGELPDRSNRKLVFSKNLSIPNGEKIFYETLNDNIFVPIFMGSNFRKKENMDIFWFQDDTVLNESILTGNTFYMSARFFNADDGSILNFGNKSLSTTASITETKDLYYQLVINKTTYTYKIYEFNNGTVGNRVGKTNSPIKFYEILGG